MLGLPIGKQPNVGGCKSARTKPNTSAWTHQTPIAAARAEGLREGMLKAADRLDLAEHDAEERDWRSGANAFAALAKAIRAAAEAKP